MNKTIKNKTNKKTSVTEFKVNAYLVNEFVSCVSFQEAGDVIPERENFVFNPGMVKNHEIIPANILTNIKNKPGFDLILSDGYKHAFSLKISKPTKKNSQSVWLLQRKITPDEHWYGMGDKPVRLDLRGRKVTNWGTDTYAFGYGADPLYKNIPYAISVSKAGCYGIFVNNTFRITFDFASDGNYFKIKGDGGKANFYLIQGDTPLEVVRNYTLLTGTPALPPLWALGYHQSRWSYYPENKVRKIANKFRKLKIPCDVIYFDIDYMDEYKVFTWDYERFKKPALLLADLKKKGFRSVAIIDPGIKIDKDYRIYQEGIDGDFFCKLPDGSNFIGPVWPGYCHFPDFTNTAVRHWWADHVYNLYQNGIDGVWNDMNEPALFNKDDMVQTQRTFPDDVIMDWDGASGNHAEGHNVYGHLMTKATWDGAAKLPAKRPLVLTRSTFAGGQKYAAVWTGDNVASWEHLTIANYQCQMLSISGFSFCGSDIGGFVGNPDGELFTRWIQLAVFHLFFRTHSSKDFDNQEPWSFGVSYTDDIRTVIEWRYRLLGYIYSAFNDHIETGIPVIRPFTLVHWEFEGRLATDQQFYFGNALLIVPVNEPGQTGCWAILPPCDWYHISENKYYREGGLCFIQTGLNGIPALLRGGAVLPVWPVMQYTGQKPVHTVELWCLFTMFEGETTTYYSDQNDGYAYRDGAFSLFIFDYKFTPDGVVIHVLQKGNMAHSPKTFVLKLLGFPSVPSMIRFNGRKIKLRDEKQFTTAKLKAESGNIEIKM